MSITQKTKMTSDIFQSHTVYDDALTIHERILDVKF